MTEEPDYLRNRGLESRGTESRGTEDRLGLGPLRRQAGTGPGGGTPTATAMPSTSAPAQTSRNPVLRRLQQGVAEARAQAARELQAKQQEAEQLRDALLPFFLTTFARPSRGAQPYNARIGTAVPVHVLRDSPYAAKQRQTFTLQYEEELAALVRHRPEYVAYELNRISKWSPLYGDYGNPIRIQPHTILHEKDARAFFPEPKQELKASAGFYSKFDDKIYFHIGRFDIAIIAHELCHACTSFNWDEFYYQFSVYSDSTAGRIGILDEAVTSELASLVLQAWHSAQRSPGSPRTGVPPDGYAGYAKYKEYREQGIRFLTVVEGGAAPGDKTMAAYFGGEITIEFNRKEPLESRVSFGRKSKQKHLLSKLLT